MKFKISKVGKNVVLGLGLCCGVASTPLKRANTSDNETSLLSEEKSELSSLAKRYTDYSTCINEYRPVVEQYLNQTRDTAETRVTSIHGAYMNDTIGSWKDYSNQATNGCEEIFSQALNEGKYSAISNITWDIETCLKKHLWIGNYCYTGSDDNYYKNLCNGYYDDMHSGDGLRVYNPTNDRIPDSERLYMPFSVPILPGLSTLDTMYSQDLSTFKENGKFAFVNFPEFLKECVEPKVETYCKQEENRIIEEENRKKKEEEDRKEAKHTLGITLSIVGAVGATAAAIAGILFYRNKKGLNDKSNSNVDNTPDIDINVRRGSTLSQPDNSNREVDIVECSFNQQDNLNRSVVYPSNQQDNLNTSVVYPFNQQDNLNRSVVYPFNQQDNLNRSVECSSRQPETKQDMILNAVNNVTPVEDCPPTYEEVARSSSVPQHNFTRDQKGVTPPRIFCPTYQEVVRASSVPQNNVNGETDITMSDRKDVKR